MSTELPFKIDRTVVIAATPEVVFRYFTDSTRWASWWGAGSTVDPKVGGKVSIRHPDGTESGGEVVEIQSPKRFVFTYGFAKGTPFGNGASRVTIVLDKTRAGTRLQLNHAMPDHKVLEDHMQGWRFQLSLFANVVSNEVNAGADAAADAWFSAFADPDTARRESTMRRITSDSVRFQDRFSNLDGIDDLLPHLTAVQRFMPGIRLERAGAVRHCQGMALCDWVMTGADGKEHGRGTNSFVFGPTGKIEWVTGFWTPMAPKLREDP